MPKVKKTKTYKEMMKEILSKNKTINKTTKIVVGGGVPSKVNKI